MRTLVRSIPLCLVITGCGGPTNEEETDTVDTGTSDTSADDSGTDDSGTDDSGTDDSGTDDSGTSDMTVEAFADAFAQAYCSKLADCRGVDVLPGGSVEACADLVAEQYLPTLADPAECTYDASLAQGCVDSLLALACEELSPDLTPECIAVCG